MIKRIYGRMAPPQILAALTALLCLVFDGMVIARLLGVDAMSAYGLASPFVTIFSALAGTVICGVQVVCSIALGQGDKKQISECYSSSVGIALLSSALFMLIVFGAGNALCVFLGTGQPGPDNVVYSMTRDYLRGYFIGAPFFFIGQMAIPYLQIMGKRRQLNWSVIVMIVSNCTLDFLSVYVFHAGMFGIGIASAMSYLISIVPYTTYFLRKDCPFRFSIHNIRAATAISILKSGSPVVFMQACYVIRVYLLNLVLLTIGGTDAVAVYAIAAAIGDILFRIGFGTGSVSLTLSSLFNSEEDRASLTELVRVMLPYTFMLIAAAVAFTELAAPGIIRLYLGSAEGVTETAVTAVRMIAISQIPCCINCVMKNYLQGVGHKGLINILNFCQNLLFAIPAAYFIGMLLGAKGIWCGIIIGEVLVFLLISILVWRKAGRIAFTAEAYSYLDPSFGADPDKCLDINITDNTDISEVSEKINEFCRRNNMSKGLSVYTSLCVEEIANNTIAYGFKADKREHMLAVHVMPRDDKWLVRFRDDCIHFDPLKYLELHDTSDPLRHIGLRLVMGMASEAVYVSALGLNNLMLIITDHSV